MTDQPITDDVRSAEDKRRKKPVTEERERNKRKESTKERTYKRLKRGATGKQEKGIRNSEY